MRTFKAIPLFGVLLVIYTMAVSAAYYSNPNSAPMMVKLLSVKLPSQQIWNLFVGDVVVIFGLGLLFIEILKSTGASDTTIVEHVLSTFVFIFYVIAFLLAPMVANSTFLILTIMSMIDVVAGFTITITAARRDFTVG